MGREGRGRKGRGEEGARRKDRRCGEKQERRDMKDS